LLIPGGILLGLGAGFASIYVIDALVREPSDARCWPLVLGAWLLIARRRRGV